MNPVILFIGASMEEDEVLSLLPMTDKDNVRRFALMKADKLASPQSMEEYRRLYSTFFKTNYGTELIWYGDSFEDLPLFVKELVNRVKDYICGEDNYGNRMAPIGATVTVVSAQPITISVSANVIIDKTMTTLENAIDVFKNDLNEYLKENVFNAATIRISKVGGVLIFREWILDYTDLKINGDIQNIETTEEQVIVVGEVNLSEQ